MTIDLRSITLGEYLERLAAAVPVPGGGAVAGVTLAQANALGSMVVGYAIGKPKFAAHDAVHRSAHAAFEAGRARAIALAEDDARAYAALNALWRLPKDDPGRAGFASAVLAAIAAPEATVVLAHDTVGELAKLCGTTSPSLASDLRIALDLAAAAALAAQFLMIWFRCCETYGRLPKAQDGACYEGRCPKCSARLRVPIGAGGTARRIFEAG